MHAYDGFYTVFYTFSGRTLKDLPVSALLHIFLLLFPLALEHSVHISVIQAQWALHQQRRQHQCYVNPEDSFHLSSLCFFPFSSPSFLLTFAEDPAITLLRYQVQLKMPNSRRSKTTLWGKTKTRLRWRACYFTLYRLWILYQGWFYMSGFKHWLKYKCAVSPRPRCFVYSVISSAVCFSIFDISLAKLCSLHFKSGG